VLLHDHLTCAGNNPPEAVYKREEIGREGGAHRFSRCRACRCRREHQEVQLIYVLVGYTEMILVSTLELCVEVWF
jgi:hypothetical protein